MCGPVNYKELLVTKYGDYIQLSLESDQIQYDGIIDFKAYPDKKEIYNN